MCNETEMHQQSQLRASDRSLSHETHVQFPFIFHQLVSQQFVSLTFSLLIFRGLDETLELYVDVNLNAQQERHFKQH